MRRVHVVSEPTTAKGDVRVLPGERGSSVQEGNVDCDPLGTVTGHRVRVIKPFGRPAGLDLYRSALTCPQAQALGVEIDSRHTGPGAVEEVEPVVVPGDHHLVADREAPRLVFLSDRQLSLAEEVMS